MCKSVDGVTLNRVILWDLKGLHSTPDAACDLKGDSGHESTWLWLSQYIKQYLYSYSCPSRSLGANPKTELDIIHYIVCSLYCCRVSITNINSNYFSLCWLTQLLNQDNQISFKNGHPWWKFILVIAHY